MQTVALRTDGTDLGYHNVGFHNPEQVSPHINELVKDGVLLEGHYTFQFCSPTRSAFLSGRLPIHVNMEQPSPGSSPGGIDLRMELISQVLKKASYKTHFIGKGHIGAYAFANLPINRGCVHQNRRTPALAACWPAVDPSTRLP